MFFTVSLLGAFKLILKIILIPLMYYFGCFLVSLAHFIGALQDLPRVYRMQTLALQDKRKMPDYFTLWGRVVDALFYPLATWSFTIGVFLLIMYFFGLI